MTLILRTTDPTSTQAFCQQIANTLSLGAALDAVRDASSNDRYELLAHWKQGEFHHDVVVQIAIENAALTLVIATNCNGGVKEVLLFDALPERYALWHWRCPTNPEFSGVLPTMLARVTTIHDFDPCTLLLDSARSELLPEHRQRDHGGGWKTKCGSQC